jgi:glutaminase
LIYEGAANAPFPIQSISKVFALSLALEKNADAIFKRVGREPSGDPFDSVIDLEGTCGVPPNPFINAEALIIVDMLVEQFGDGARDAVRDLVRDGIDDPAAKATLAFDDDVLNEGGDLNGADMLIALMGSSIAVKAKASDTPASVPLTTWCREGDGHTEYGM